RREVSALTDARKTLAYDFFRILRAPQGEAAAFMDVLKQLLLFEDNFRLFGRDLVYKIEKLKIR
ncbi:hypothetical protein NLO61_26630, partial [Klebsiella pneumoniae]|nr:hypothetical protein [Klebsiella pneumoniae]MCP3612919.1 hypothetical protein [Klebsiella pneumoniae]MCP3627863.1 hypothetical protein [Klebsiella pneumoniae]